MVAELLSVKELARLIKVNKSTLYLWVNQRRIPHVKLGAKVLFDQKDIESWVLDNKRQVVKL